MCSTLVQLGRTGTPNEPYEWTKESKQGEKIEAALKGKYITLHVTLFLETPRPQE